MVLPPCRARGPFLRAPHTCTVRHPTPHLDKSLCGMVAGCLFELPRFCLRFRDRFPPRTLSTTTHHLLMLPRTTPYTAPHYIPIARCNQLLLTLFSSPAGCAVWLYWLTFATPARTDMHVGCGVTTAPDDAPHRVICHTLRCCTATLPTSPAPAHAPTLPGNDYYTTPRFPTPCLQFTRYIVPVPIF